MNNEQLISTFYAAFAAGDYKTMQGLYHSDIVFEDPAFGELHGTKAGKMWEMLLTQTSTPPKITYSHVEVVGDTGSARWVAEYNFGPKKRHVVNHITAKFKFKDGKIIDHRDSFSMWQWSRQALGCSGIWLGWSPLVKNKVRQTVTKQLDRFIRG